MIVNQFGNIRPMPFTILASELDVTAAVIPEQPFTGDYCWCNAICPDTQYVFSGPTDLKNDKTSVIYRRYTASDTVAIELYKAGVKIADLDDDTLGTFYESTNDTGQLYTGFLLDWSLVQAAHGSGTYQICTTMSILGQALTDNSVYFSLIPWNEDAADCTVKVESYQNGYTESSSINFSGMNWYSSVRLEGYFRNRQPELIKDEYQDSTRTIRQIQDKITDSYQLELINLAPQAKDKMVYDDILANSIFITGYSIDSEIKYLRIGVRPDEIESLDYKVNEPGSNMVIKMVSSQDNILKRNINF